ncbi:MAG TPA: DUF4235 domain-containing protein [Streptosporangiaceae bacterium]|nr:DUF4235 domain-containing protein [Streptosporangiaceae bacterium]
MSDKGESANKALAGAAAFGAAYAVRKLMNLGWKRVTGKEPPTDPQDPLVGTWEALSWAIALGIVMAAVRVLAVRATTGRMRRAAASQVEAGKSARS